mgnify:FL=1
MIGPINDQDFTWQVYADWLEERGDPRADQIRAELAEASQQWEYEYRGGGAVGGVGGTYGGGGGVGGW